jgi:hypothetical protein
MKKIELIFICVLLAVVSQAQNLHVGLLAGVSNYQGDLQRKRFTLDQSHFAAGIGGLYELSDKFYLRAYFTYGTISATDKKDINKERNLSFGSTIMEVHLGLEYDLLNLYEYTVSPYLFLGVGGYHFNPYAIDKNGDKVYLQPLGTEGQNAGYLGRKKYGLTQLSIPFGGGFKFAVTDDVRIRLELGLRKLFTDYLDDVSTTYPSLAALSSPLALSLSFRGGEIKPTAIYPLDSKRGNPSSKDWYYFSTFSISFRLKAGRDKSHLGKGNLGCPVKVY